MKLLSILLLMVFAPLLALAQISPTGNTNSFWNVNVTSNGIFGTSLTLGDTNNPANRLTNWNQIAGSIIATNGFAPASVTNAANAVNQSSNTWNSALQPSATNTANLAANGVVTNGGFTINGSPVNNGGSMTVTAAGTTNIAVVASTGPNAGNLETNGLGNIGSLSFARDASGGATSMQQVVSLGSGITSAQTNTLAPAAVTNAANAVNQSSNGWNQATVAVDAGSNLWNNALQLSQALSVFYPLSGNPSSFLTPGATNPVNLAADGMFTNGGFSINGTPIVNGGSINIAGIGGITNGGVTINGIILSNTVNVTLPGIGYKGSNQTWTGINSFNQPINANDGVNANAGITFPPTVGYVGIASNSEPMIFENYNTNGTLQDFSVFLNAVGQLQIVGAGQYSLGGTTNYLVINTGTLPDYAGIPAVDYQNRRLYDLGGVASENFGSYRALIGSNTSTVATWVDVLRDGSGYPYLTSPATNVFWLAFSGVLTNGIDGAYIWRPSTGSNLYFNTNIGQWTNNFQSGDTAVLNKGIYAVPYFGISGLSNFSLIFLNDAQLISSQSANPANALNVGINASSCTNLVLAGVWLRSQVFSGFPTNIDNEAINLNQACNVVVKNSILQMENYRGKTDVTDRDHTVICVSGTASNIIFRDCDIGSINVGLETNEYGSYVADHNLTNSDTPVFVNCALYGTQVGYPDTGANSLFVNCRALTGENYQYNGLAQWNNNPAFYTQVSGMSEAENLAHFIPGTASQLVTNSPVSTNLPPYLAVVGNAYVGSNLTVTDVGTVEGNFHVGGFVYLTGGYATIGTNAIDGNGDSLEIWNANSTGGQGGVGQLVVGTQNSGGAADIYLYVGGASRLQIWSTTSTAMGLTGLFGQNLGTVDNSGNWYLNGAVESAGFKCITNATYNNGTVAASGGMLTVVQTNTAPPITLNLGSITSTASFTLGSTTITWTVTHSP